MGLRQAQAERNKANYPFVVSLSNHAFQAEADRRENAFSHRIRLQLGKLGAEGTL